MRKAGRMRSGGPQHCANRAAHPSAARSEPVGLGGPVPHKKIPRESLGGFFMRKAGLEPARPNSHKNLNLACLPIPTLPRTKDNLSDMELLVNNIFLFFSGYAGSFEEPA